MWPGSACGAQPVYGRSGDWFKTGGVGGQDRGSHARVPEVPQVSRSLGHGSLLALGGEVAGDLVGHVDQAGAVHYSAGSAWITRRDRLACSA